MGNSASDIAKDEAPGTPGVPDTSGDPGDPNERNDGEEQELAPGPAR